jgi:predicted ribosome quality control (RQC) complex YloA/Tae2 family protein
MKTEMFNYNKMDYTIIIGKNKKENWQIIDDAIETDIWFHVSESPSCHVILKNVLSALSAIPIQVIKRCAYLCKINSNAKYEKKSVIIYTSILNVKKTNNEGEVIVTNCKNVTL